MSGDATGFTADAAADIDANGVVQFWGYIKPAKDGSIVGARIGCDTTGMDPTVVRPCDSAAGQSIF